MEERGLSGGGQRETVGYITFQLGDRIRYDDLSKTR